METSPANVIKQLNIVEASSVPVWTRVRFPPSPLPLKEQNAQTTRWLGRFLFVVGSWGGTQLSLDQATRLLRGENVPDADPNDVRELLNYRSAFAFVSESLAQGDPITERFIRGIHHKLVEGVRGGKADPGNYRKIQNYVVNSSTKKVIYTPPTATEVPILMSELVAWLNSNTDIHPILISGIAQFQLVHIHPFLDGNERASR